MRCVLILCFIVCTGFGLQGQECSGSLGENLFAAGDFGSGSTYSLDTDPGLAPGYFYDRAGPPDDGEYIITNNVARWPFVFGTWLVIQDPSPDPNGYMMVVNASFEPGLFYEEQVEELCDDTDFEFSADILNMIQRGVGGHILPNVEFLIDDVVVLRTGDIPQDEEWHRYSFSFRTDPGQTSLKLSLRNNAPGGIGNDLALDNISFRACGPPGEVFSVGGEVLCQENLPAELTALLDGVEVATGFYQWERLPVGQTTWTVIEGQSGSRLPLTDDSPGRYFYRFATSASPASFDNLKCRFFSEPGLIEIPERDFMVFDTICGGTDIPFGEELIETPGIYIRNLTSGQGCDSVIIYNLDTVRRATLSGSLRITDPFCPGQATAVIEGLNPSGGYAPYFIEVNNMIFDGLIADGLPAGAGMAEIKDKFGCFVSFDFEITDPPPFDLDIGSDRQIILGEVIDLNATASHPITAIQWAPPLESFEDMTSISFLPIASASISATAFNENDCSAADAITIEVVKDVRLYVPNIFSPNNDGVNDDFAITGFGLSLAQIAEMVIYDRWGNVVWSVANTDPAVSWDGKGRDGDPVRSGVYTYTLTALLINGETIDRKGSLTLIR